RRPSKTIHDPRIERGIIVDSVHFEEAMDGIMKEMSKGSDIPEIFTQVKIKELYTTAYRLYRDKHYTDASYFFRLLLVADPGRTKYWKGLGACLQMLGEHRAALNCYVLCQTLNLDQPDPYLYIHAADCYFAIGEVESGLKALD